MSTITTNDGRTYKTPSLLTTAGAITAGQAVQTLPVAALGIPVSDFAISKIRKINQNIDTVQINKAINQAMEISGMKEKGLKLFKFSPKENLKQDEVYERFFKKFSKIMEKPVNPNKPLKPINVFNNLFISLTKHGYNAGFNPQNNAVYINVEKFGTSAFHEIGHAINYNSSKFWRGMQKARLPFMVLGVVLPLVAQCKRKKVEGEEPKNAFDKVTTFIKENVGKLTALTFVPIIAEELKASARGNKLAMKILSPENAKAVIKSNKFGALTYISVAVLSGLGAYGANKIRDMIAKPKQV